MADSSTITERRPQALTRALDRGVRTLAQPVPSARLGEHPRAVAQPQREAAPSDHHGAAPGSPTTSRGIVESRAAAFSQPFLAQILGQETAGDGDLGGSAEASAAASLAYRRAGAQPHLYRHHATLVRIVV